MGEKDCSTRMTRSVILLRMRLIHQCRRDRGCSVSGFCTVRPLLTSFRDGDLRGDGAFEQVRGFQNRGTSRKRGYGV